MTNSMPEVDGRSLWEVVVRMETKLDVALGRLDDHEDRLRASAPQADLDRLAAKVDLLSIEHTQLANRPVVTPKGMLTAMAAAVSTMVGLVALVNVIVMGLAK